MLGAGVAILLAVSCYKNRLVSRRYRRLYLLIFLLSPLILISVVHLDGEEENLNNLSFKICRPKLFDCLLLVSLDDKGET